MIFMVNVGFQSVNKHRQTFYSATVRNNQLFHLFLPD